MIGRYRTDAIPRYYARCYQFLTGRGFSRKTDIYSLTIRFLEMATNCFDPETYHRTTNYASKINNYCVEFVHELDIPENLRTVIINNLSEDGPKEYLGDHLRCLKKENGRYLRFK